MAHTPIATVTTLAQMIDEIRERTNTLSEEESEFYFLPLANLCHDAILLARDKLNPQSIREFYTTEPTGVTETSNLVDISGLDIYSMDPDDLVYSDSLNGRAAMMSLGAFEDLKTIYTPALMATFFIAYTANTQEKAQLVTYRGSSLVGAGTLKLGYIRNPVKQTVAALKLDCTESMVRQAIEIVVQWVPQRLRVGA